MEIATSEEKEEVVFESIDAAANHLGICHKSILDNISGRTKLSQSKFDRTYWKFRF